MKRELHKRTKVSNKPDIAARLKELRNHLLVEYEQCGADRSETDSEDATERACTSTADILRHLLIEIREVEAALERLTAGQYGLCVDCGARISASRLRAVPTARRCMRCQVGVERKVG